MCKMNRKADILQSTLAHTVEMRHAMSLPMRQMDRLFQIYTRNSAERGKKTKFIDSVALLGQKRVNSYKKLLRMDAQAQKLSILLLRTDKLDQIYRFCRSEWMKF